MVARNVLFSSLPYEAQYRIADSYSNAVRACGGPSNTPVDLMTKWNSNSVLLEEIEANINKKYGAFSGVFGATINLLNSVGPYSAQVIPVQPTGLRTEDAASIKVKGDTYEASIRNVGDLAGKLDIRTVETDRPRLSKLEKWSLLVDGKRTIYDSQEAAMESAKRRAKPALLYHHIQEIDDQGIVHHSEDKYIGNVGYADDKSRERVILTFKGTSFASAAKKGTIKETKKKRKYYV